MTVQDICASLLDSHLHDCSGFARAVAAALKVPLIGDADAIADVLAGAGDGWTVLPDGQSATTAAATHLVLAALRGDRQANPDPHGHVAVIVPGPLSHGKYPTAYWGSLGGTPGRNQTINWAWTAADRDHVIYAAHAIPA